MKEISEINVYVKFEKSLGMPQYHLSNPTPSKVQRAKPPPSNFAISRPPNELNNGAQHHCCEEEDGYLRGLFLGPVD